MGHWKHVLEEPAWSQSFPLFPLSVAMKWAATSAILMFCDTAGLIDLGLKPLKPWAKSKTFCLISLRYFTIAMDVWEHKPPVGFWGKARVRDGAREKEEGGKSVEICIWNWLLGKEKSRAMSQILNQKSQNRTRLGHAKQGSERWIGCKCLGWQWLSLGKAGRRQHVTICEFSRKRARF